MIAFKARALIARPNVSWATRIWAGLNRWAIRSLGSIFRDCTVLRSIGVGRLPGA